MKNLKVLFSILLLIVITTSCTYAKIGVISNKTFPIKSFTSVESEIVGNIIYSQSNSVSVRAEGDEKMVDNLEVSESKGILKIVHATKFNKKRKGNLIIFISSPAIASVDMYGVGNWIMKGKVKTDDLKIEIEGVGNFEALGLECNNIKATCEGVGNLMLSGTTEFVKIESEGVGSVNAKNMIAKIAVVKSHGVGSVKCYASENIDIVNSGVGSVTYYGNPTVKNIKNSGVGKVNAGK